MNKIEITQGSKLSTKLTSVDTLYELSGIFDLDGEVIEIPSGCVLKFTEGSKITNGTLSLNNTIFEGAKHSIAALMSGTQYELDTDDFDLTGSNKVTIMQSIVSTATSIQLHGRLENVFNNITINKVTSFIGNGSLIVNSTSTNRALNITTDDFVRINDLDFEISSGCAIYKEAIPTNDAKLSFIICNCKFKLTSYNTVSFIKLKNSREGNIINCFFTGNANKINNIEYRYGIGIERIDAVNTNIIGCMFSYLDYGIKATAEHITPSSEHPGDIATEVYSKYACGLSVQSAVIISCRYGVFMEGNDSFFLQNSMVDFCLYPLVLLSQDGANITNNYFATSIAIFNGGSLTYNATITIRNNTSSITNPWPEYSQLTDDQKAVLRENNRCQRIIIANNTIYGHRSSNNNGIDMAAKSKDCTIQGNTLDSFTDHGIYMRNASAESTWTTEKLRIDNNRFYFKGPNQDGIGGYTGDQTISITNNYAKEGSTTKLINVGSPYYGNYVYSGNHDYLSAVPSGNEGSKIYWASLRNCTRMKIGLTMAANQNTLTISNPMNGDTNLTVYVANNRYPICVYSVSSTQIVFTKTTSEAVSFTAIIEHFLNM